MNFVLKCKSFHSFGVLCTLSTLSEEKCSKFMWKAKKRKVFLLLSRLSGLTCLLLVRINNTHCTQLLRYCWYLHFKYIYRAISTLTVVMCVCAVCARNKMKMKWNAKWTGKFLWKTFLFFYLSSFFVSKHRCALWSSLVKHTHRN